MHTPSAPGGARPTKNLVVLSDGHAGHMFGLCSPEFQLQPSECSLSRFHEKAYEWQTHTWGWFASAIKRLGPIDHLVYNGDAIEGKGYRSGATELLTADRNAQVNIAKAVIDFCAPAAVTIVRGTPSHTGEEEDWEDVLAEKLGVRAEDHAWLTYGPTTFDIKHHIGSSSVPGGVPPSLTRDAVWNLLWAEKQLQPRANVIIRSHLHKHVYVGDEDSLAIVTPALQGWTKYGAKRMSKTITYGFVSFNVHENGDYTWTRHILNPTFAASHAQPI